MPYRWVEPELYCEHQGVKVYRTYRHDMESDGTSDNILTTDVTNSDRDNCDGFHFDIRDIESSLVDELGEEAVMVAKASDQFAVIKKAIEEGIIPIPNEAYVGIVMHEAGNLEGSLVHVLDELVHDVASKEASAVNNEAIDGQVVYLIEKLGVSEAMRLIRNEIRILREDEC